MPCGARTRVLTVALARFRRDQRGSLLAEAAIIMPLLVMIVLAGVEVGRYTLLQQKLNRTAVSMADLIAQSETLTLTDITNLYEAAAFVVRPFDLNEGLVIVSSVSKTGANPPTIDWQCAGAGTSTASSALGSPGGPATLPTELSLQSGETVIYAEVFYDFEPSFFPDVLGPHRVRHTAAFRPRFGALSEISAGPSPPADPPSCSPVT